MEKMKLSQEEIESTVAELFDGYSGAISSSELARLAGLSEKTLANLRSQGKTPPRFYLGRRTFFRVEDARKWVLDRATQHGA